MAKGEEMSNRTAKLTYDAATAVFGSALVWMFVFAVRGWLVLVVVMIAVALLMLWLRQVLYLQVVVNHLRNEFLTESLGKQKGK